jgi:hypothetical protein
MWLAVPSESRALCSKASPFKLWALFKDPKQLNSRKTHAYFVHTPQHSNTTAVELHLFRIIRSIREEKPLNGGKKSFFRFENHKIQPHQPRKQTFRTPRLHTSFSNHVGPTIEPFQSPAVTLVHRDELPSPVPCARLDRRATRTAE